MKKFLLAIFTSLVITVPGIAFSQNTDFAHQQTRPEVAENVKAYEGPEGVVVWTLRYGKPAEHKMLVQITNVDHPWNTKIQLMGVEDTGSRKYIYTIVNDKRFNVVFFNENGWGTLTLPGEKNSLPVFYSKEYSAEGNAQHFLTDYLESLR